MTFSGLCAGSTSAPVPEPLSLIWGEGEDGVSWVCRIGDATMVGVMAVDMASRLSAMTLMEVVSVFIDLCGLPSFGQSILVLARARALGGDHSVASWLASALTKPPSLV